MQKTMTRLFWAGFAVLWGWVAANSVLRWAHNGLAAFAAGLILAAGFFALAKWVLPRLNGLSARRWRLVCGLAFGAYVLALGRLAFLLAEVPIMDQEVVLRTLPDLLDDGRFGVWSGYYIVCNNNLGLALLLGGWYKLAGLFGFAPGSDLAGVGPGIALNVLALAASVALACRLAKKVFKTNSAAALAFLLCAGFAPFVLYSPCYYSDSLSMPFALLAMLAFTAWQTQQSRAKRLALAAAMGAAVFAGFAIKGSVAVVLAALVILFFLQAGPKRAAAAGLAALACFGLLLGGYRLWQRAGLIDWADEEALTLPTQLWFCYGSHDEGNYSQADYEAAMSVDTIAQRKQLLTRRIAQNYAAMSPVQLAEFVTKKAAITWGDGLYNAEEFLATPQRANWTHFFILQGQPGYMPLVYYCQAYLYMVQLLVLLFAAQAALRPGAVPGALTLAGVSVTGLMLFLSLWETKARYAFNFTPLLLLLAAGGLLVLASPRQKGQGENGANITDRG